MTASCPGVCWRRHSAAGVTMWSLLRTARKPGTSCQGHNPPTLAVLDWMMPGYTGPELCRLVRQRAAEPYTYILLLTSRNEKDDVVEGMDSGADDYITKPFDKHELKVRLTGRNAIVDLQEQLVAAREALRIQATRDYLTQLWNRSSILDILHRELARSEREQVPMGVVVADLDHFKASTTPMVTSRAILRSAGDVPGGCRNRSETTTRSDGTVERSSWSFYRARTKKAYGCKPNECDMRSARPPYTRRKRQLERHLQFRLFARVSAARLRPSHLFGRRRCAVPRETARSRPRGGGSDD